MENAKAFGDSSSSYEQPPETHITTGAPYIAPILHTNSSRYIYPRFDSCNEETQDEEDDLFAGLEETQQVEEPVEEKKEQIIPALNKKVEEVNNILKKENNYEKLKNLKSNSFYVRTSFGSTRILEII